MSNSADSRPGTFVRLVPERSQLLHALIDLPITARPEPDDSCQVLGGHRVPAKSSPTSRLRKPETYAPLQCRGYR